MNLFQKNSYFAMLLFIISIVLKQNIATWIVKQFLYKFCYLVTQAVGYFHSWFHGIRGIWNKVNYLAIKPRQDPKNCSKFLIEVTLFQTICTRLTDFDYNNACIYSSRYNKLTRKTVSNCHLRQFLFTIFRMLIFWQKFHLEMRSPRI